MLNSVRTLTDASGGSVTKGVRILRESKLTGGTSGVTPRIESDDSYTQFKRRSV